MIVEGQVHGGLAQGIGQALLKELSMIRWSVDHKPIWIMRCHELMIFLFMRLTERHHALISRVKGCGEAGAIGSTPAIVNSVRRFATTRHQGSRNAVDSTKVYCGSKR